MKTDELPDNMKKNPFQVPEGYFDNFPDCVRERIKTSESEKPSKIRKLRPIILMAACTTLVLAGMFLYRMINPIHSGESTSLAAYIEETGMLEEFNSDELLAMASANDYNYTEEEIRSYLLNEDIEVNEIIEEL